VIFNAYRLFICIIMAIHGGPLINYIFYDIPISPSTAGWGCALTVLFLFERLYITIRMEHDMRQDNARVDKN
jgi:hypothetical protein